MPVDPREILGEIAPDTIPADAPPEAANYRDADIQGVACAFCTKFVVTGARDANGVAVPVGICDQWEATVDGVKVCDRFASGSPAYDHQGNEVWDFADAENREFNEIHLAGTEVTEDSGFVVKEVLRTGEWPVIPTAQGVVKKPLKIIRDGVSDSKAGVIAMSELVANFQAGAIDRVQIPLSDDREDHKNITRLNTGYIRGLWIEDKGEGAVLKAKMEFTEPEVKEKVLRGTYSDVSCGIPWRIRSRGKEFGATLEHVCITNRPFIDGLGPFMTASDQEDREVEVVNFGEKPATEQGENEAQEPGEQPQPAEIGTETEEQQEKVKDLSFAEIRDQIWPGEMQRLGLNAAHYHFADLRGNEVKIFNDISKVSWTAEIEVSDGKVSLSAPQEWKVEGETDEPSAVGGSPKSEFSDMEQARRLRELRLSQPSTTKRAKESDMPLSREELAALELSEDARAAIQSVLDENARLSAQTRQAEADRRVDELKALGLSDRPGALKFYRSVFLSDDGGPAVVLSDDGQEKKRLTALEVLDQFIEGVKGPDGNVNLSDQALISGNDEKPPAESETESKKSVEDRTAEARESLYGKK